MQTPDSQLGNPITHIFNHKKRGQQPYCIEYAMFSLEYFKCKTLIHDSKTLLYHEPGESKQIHNKSTRQSTKSFHHINETYINMKDLL